MDTSSLIEQILFSDNLNRAYLQVVRNKGAEYGVSSASISNWVRTYREECQTNDAAKSEYEYW